MLLLLLLVLVLLSYFLLRNPDSLRCTAVKYRFKFFLEEWEGSVRSIEIKREGRLEKMYFVVPEWCMIHWKKTPVVEMR